MRKWPVVKNRTKRQTYQSQGPCRPILFMFESDDECKVVYSNMFLAAIFVRRTKRQVDSFQYLFQIWCLKSRIHRP